MLSDKKTRNLTTNKRHILDVNRHWSDSQKAEAVTTYLLLGNQAAAARTLGIPLATFALWRKTDWWIKITEQIREQENLVLSAKLKNIYEKTLTVVSDRLEHGDFVWDQKAQRLVRKPISMKDAHKVGMDFMIHTEKLVKPEHQEFEEDTIKEKLNKLAQSFAEFAHKQEAKPVVQVTDVVFATEEVSEGEESAIHKT